VGCACSLKADPTVWYFGGSGGNSSVVECDLAKVEVAGSNPVSRSNISSRQVRQGGSQDPPFIFYGAPSPRGKAEVCKTSTPGSNPGGASTTCSMN
jgi:hypothetical protein